MESYLFPYVITRYEGHVKPLEGLYWGEGEGQSDLVFCKGLWLLHGDLTVVKHKWIQGNHWQAVVTSIPGGRK